MPPRRKARRNQVFHRFSEPACSTPLSPAACCLCLPCFLPATLVARPVLNMAGGFEALGLAPELVRAVTEDLGYLLPTNVQVRFEGNLLPTSANFCCLLVGLLLLG